MFTHALALTILNRTPQVENQAYFAILAETTTGRMVGMEIPQLPPGFKLPPEAAMFMGQTTRVLNMRLWSPTIAPPNSTAVVSPPAGLKQGAKLDMELYRPKPGETGPTSREFDPDKQPSDFTIKIYWGSSETVREGQPKVLTWKDMMPDDQAEVKKRAAEMQPGGSYFYKAGWTTAYWPTKKQPGAIGGDASLVGLYALVTNYTGNVDIEAPSNVNFLDAYKFSSPNLDKKADLKKALNLVWQPIANCLGQNAYAIGMEGKNTMIIWSSSEVFGPHVFGDGGFMQMADVRAQVEKTEFMPGDATKVDVPAGIFAKSQFCMLSMSGYGPGAALQTAQPLPRIQTKTTAKLMFGEPR